MDLMTMIDGLVSDMSEVSVILLLSCLLFLFFRQGKAEFYTFYNSRTSRSPGTVHYQYVK